MDLNAVRMLIKVAQTGSFTRAAEALGMSQPGLSRAIARLEQTVGTRLLHRSTRHLALTVDGQAFVDSCAPLLAGLEEAERQLADRHCQPTGTLRLSAPSAFGRTVLMPVLAGLMQRHRTLSIEAVLSDRRVDVIEEGFDAVLRSGPIGDVRLVAQPLPPLRWVTVASPEYLRAHGVPQDLESLPDHACLGVRDPRSGRLARWQFLREGVEQDVEIQARLAFDHGDPLLEAAELGMGLAQVMEFFVAPALAAGRLQRVLQHREGRSHPLALVYPPSRQRSPRLRALAQALAEAW